jgi:hypothetical protein
LARLANGFSRTGLSYRDLWLRQLALGGDADALELEAYLLGLLPLSSYQYDVIAQALNEFFMDAGEGHTVPYSDF